jgi:hypothetical protein
MPNNLPKRSRASTIVLFVVPSDSLRSLTAGATLLGGIGQGLAAFGKPASVVPKDYDPDKLSGLY